MLIFGIILVSDCMKIVDSVSQVVNSQMVYVALLKASELRQCIALLYVLV